MIAWYLMTAAVVFFITLIAVAVSKNEKIKDNVLQLLACAIFWPIFILAITSFTIENHE